MDLATEALRAGWAKPKESKREPTEEDNKRQELANEAKAGGKGMWRRLYVVGGITRSIGCNKSVPNRS